MEDIVRERVPVVEVVPVTVVEGMPVALAVLDREDVDESVATELELLLGEAVSAAVDEGSLVCVTLSLGVFKPVGDGVLVEL